MKMYLELALYLKNCQVKSTSNLCTDCFLLLLDGSVQLTGKSTKKAEMTRVPIKHKKGTTDNDKN